MIELVSESRCITCNKCVQVCPMNVFEAVKDAPPIIARLSCSWVRRWFARRWGELRHAVHCASGAISISTCAMPSSI